MQEDSTYEHVKNNENLKSFEIHEISHEMHSLVDFSTSNIQISHADACVRCCAGFSYHMVRSTLCDDVP